MLCAGGGRQETFSPVSHHRVLIIGGYGAFGARLAPILDASPRFESLIAGRNIEKAQKLIETLRGPALKQAALIDIDCNLAQSISDLKPDFVVHCAGPFQGQDYRVAEACIAAGVSYTDLADGRDFVSGISMLDEKAKEAGVFVLSGASTTPALSSAAALHLAGEFSKVTAISIGVTPGNRAPRGLAVVRGILSYVGEQVPILRNGKVKTVPGWGDLKRTPIEGLGGRWFSTVDTPDVDLMPTLFPDLQQFDFRAGLELSLLHLPLWLLAKLRKVRILPNLASAAPAFRTLAEIFESFGTDRGGMFVHMAGEGVDGKARQARWTLVASAGDGPYIPATAAAILADKLAHGETIALGARACVKELTLTDFEQAFQRFNITTQTEVYDGENALSSLARA